MAFFRRCERGVAFFRRCERGLIRLRPYRGEALTKKKGVVRAASTLHFCDKFRTCAQYFKKHFELFQVPNSSRPHVHAPCDLARLRLCCFVWK